MYDSFALKVVVFRNVRRTGSARMKTKEDIEHPANALHSYTFNAGREVWATRMFVAALRWPGV